MAERPSKRQRGLVAENDDSEGSSDWYPGNPYGRHIPATASAAPAPARPRRGVAAARASNAQGNSDPSGPSIRLNMKVGPSRLRQVTNSSSPAGAERERLGRNSKNKRPIVEESSDDDEDENDEGFDDGEGEADSEDDEDGGTDDDAEEDVEAESEDEDDEADEEMEETVVPVPPKIRMSGPGTNRKPSPRQALKKGNVKSVEDKQIQQGGTGMSSDNEELSELDSADEDENEGEEQEDNNDEEEGEDEEDEEEDAEMDDVELEDERGDVIAPDAIGEDELGSSDEGGDGSSEFNSRSGTPDLSKLTRRQRAHFQEIDGDLMALSNEAQKKKFFTAEQITMRRAEMARRRKDLSEKRNEEEKTDTLNRLLHKPAPKRRSRKEVLEEREREQFGTPALMELDGEITKANKLYVRTVFDGRGTRVGVPEEWLGHIAGRVFEGAKRDDGGKSLPVGKVIEVIE